MSVYSAYLEVASKAAKQAGEIQRADFGKKQVAIFKSAHDIGLEIDKWCEKVIVDAISSAFPEHGIYSEEMGGWISKANIPGLSTRWMVPIIFSPGLRTLGCRLHSSDWMSSCLVWFKIRSRISYFWLKKGQARL